MLLDPIVVAIIRRDGLTVDEVLRTCEVARRALAGTVRE
jgi:hypothetical protein